MVNIITDSCCDLSADLIRANNIYIVPLYVSVGEQNYRDGVDITMDKLFASVAETGKLPKTAAPSIGDFASLFETLTEEIVFIGIGSKLSATVQNARLAAEQLGRKDIYIVDSANLSTGIGLLVMKAVDFRAQGKNAAEIVDCLNSLLPKVETAFVLDRLDYMYMGGRCSAMQNLMSSLLHIRPVIEVRKDGTLGVKDKIRGSRKKALNSLVEDFKQHLPGIDLDRVFITHTGCDEDAAYLENELHGVAEIGNIFQTHAGATISSHCGPNTIGILYISN